ncbi:MAG: hypothetical protein LAP87_04250 [Acidobacteriia bacterium]|nr:hypothetical protein [Terriglobia bacterium]
MVDGEGPDHISRPGMLSVQASREGRGDAHDEFGFLARRLDVLFAVPRA